MNFRLTALLAVLPLAFVAMPSVASAADAAAGKVIFDANCSSCHGVSGKGDGPVGAALNPPPRNFTIGDFAFDPDANGAYTVQALMAGAIFAGGGPEARATYPARRDPPIDDKLLGSKITGYQNH